MKKKVNIPSIDNHHGDVFKMINLLDDAIKGNSRQSFEPIIKFLEIDCLNHFQEEEDIMIKNNVKDIKNHQLEHERFKNKIKQIKKMYNESIHTTHIAYGIRQLIDLLIIHSQKVDTTLKGLKK